MQAIGKTQSRLGRSADAQHLLRAEELIVGEPVIDQERRGVERAQDRLEILMSPFAPHPNIAVINGMQLAPLLIKVEEAPRADLLRLHYKMRRHGQIAVNALAVSNVRAVRFDDARKAPHRNLSPACFSGKE